MHEQKDVISGLGDDKRALRNTIAELEKDVAGLRKELGATRFDTIGDKEKRISTTSKKKTPGSRSSSLCSITRSRS